MEIDTQHRDGVAVLTCSGRLNMVAAPRLRAELRSVVEAGTSRLVVDLTGTAFIDSSGLGALIGGLKEARQAGGDLRIAGPGQQVLTVLRLTNLDKVLRPYPTAAEAVSAW